MELSDLATPKVYLHEMDNTFILVNSKKDMKELMRVFELSGMKMKGPNKSPLESVDSWDNYKENTCVSAYIAQRLGSSGIGIDPLESIERWRDTEVISQKEYYQLQGMISGKLREINNYFDQKGKESSVMK